MNPLLSIVALTAAAFTVHAAAQTRHVTPCVDGSAGSFTCENVDLVGQLDLTALSAGGGNDLWGWTDPVTGVEYALMGLNNGTAFVSLEVPDHPLLIGKLPTQSSSSLWRDIKVYDDHAFIVSEAASHGMQVFDLARLRAVTTPPVTFTADTVYNQFGRAHNIVINEDSGFAYAVGSRQGAEQCNAGLHMIDVSDPLDPQFAGCFGADGYTHDAQCVMYTGPDTDHAGSEICFAANEDTVTIVDVSDKQAPSQVSRTPYAGSGYTHQGWLTPDQRWLLVDDETDETSFGHNTRTYVFDVGDLDAPVLSTTYTGPVASSDHNLYTRGRHAFLANYRSGLRILDIEAIAQGQVEEVAFFDTYPASDNPGFSGAWSNYPYFDSGLVIVSDTARGLFVLQPQLCTAPQEPDAPNATAMGDNRIDLDWPADADPLVRYEVWRELGGCGAGPGERVGEDLANASFSDLTASGGVDYGYRVRAVAPSGECASGYSACVVAQTTGACTAPPQFAGLASVASATDGSCRLDLAWTAATASCSGPVAYEVHRGTNADFLPDTGNLIADDVAAPTYADASVLPETDYHYLVRARDLGNDVGDGNLVRLSGRALGAIGDGDWHSGAETGDPVLEEAGNPVRHVAWHVVDDVAHSGERSYTSGYVNGECIALSSEILSLTPGQTAELRFFTRYGIETGWDGGVVQISSDNGQTWQTLIPDGAYPSAIANGGNACGLPVGTGVYSGSNLTWHEQVIPLDGYSGDIRLRWQFSTDSAETAEGWWLDDLVVSHVQVAGMCTAVSDLIFGDGFEPQPAAGD